MKKLLLCLFTCAAISGPLAAAISVNGTQVVTENFNTLPTAAGRTEFNWTDDVTIKGFYLHRSNSPAGQANLAGALTTPGARPYTTDGSVTATTVPNHHGFLSLGLSGDSERALGACPTTTDGSSNWCGGTLSIVAIITNDGSTPTELVSLGFDVENWRGNASTAVPESITCTYKVGEASALLAELAAGSASATFAIPGYAPMDGGGFDVTSGDGFNFSPAIPPGSFPIADALSTPIRLDAGRSIAIRWGNINDAGTDAQVGIDNFSASFAGISTAINPTVSNVVRDDNATPLNPADDKINFTLIVNATGPVGPGWQITSPASLAASGTYGVPKNYAGIPITEFANPTHTLTGTVADTATASMSSSFAVTAPWCAISASAANFTYDDRGTADPADDFTRYQITPTGTFTGATCLVDTGLQGQFNVPYGEPLSQAITPVGNIRTAFGFTDSADPSCTASLTVHAPGNLGINRLTNPPGRWLSLPDFSATRIWDFGFDAGSPFVMQSSSTQQGDYTILSEIVDVSGIGAVSVGATLEAISGLSSGFEAADHFRIDLIIDGRPPVSMLGAADIDGNGQLDGGFAGNGQELPDTSQSNVTKSWDFSAPVPASANTVQLRIVGNTNSPNETLLVRNIVIDGAVPTVQVSAATSIVRHENGPGVEDDTLTFDATITGFNTSPEWRVIVGPLTPGSGPYGPVSFTLPAPLPLMPSGIPYMTEIVDSANGAVGDMLVVPIPPRGIIGQHNFGGALKDIATAITPAPAAGYVIDSIDRVTQINGLNEVGETFLESEVLNLSAVGSVNFTAKLRAEDSSIGSNYETADRFKAELIYETGGVPVTINLIAPFDTGNGAPSTIAPGTNGPPDGYLNGYTGSPGTNAVNGTVYPAGIDDYNANRARDEFNRDAQEAGEALVATFDLAGTIPANANNVRLKLSVMGVVGSETLHLSEVLFASAVAPPIVPGQASMGLNPGVSGKMTAVALAALGSGGSGPLSVPAVQSGPTAGGGRASLVDGWVIYEPAAGFFGGDSFTYTLTDGAESVQGTVTVAVANGIRQTMNVVDITAVAGGGNSLTGMGIPGRFYRWETSPNLSNWSPLGSASRCPASGVMSIVDPPPLPESRFYRLVENGAP